MASGSGEPAATVQSGEATDAPALGDRGTGGPGQLVLHSEDDDLLSKLTSAAVCVLKVRETMLNYVANLGYGVTVSKLLVRAAKVENKGNGPLSSSCLRLLNQFSGSGTIVSSIASAALPFVSTFVSTLKPLHADSAFTLDTLKNILEKNIVAVGRGGGGVADAVDSLGGGERTSSAILGEALREDVGLVPFLMTVLDGSAEESTRSTRRNTPFARCTLSISSRCASPMLFWFDGPFYGR